MNKDINENVTNNETRKHILNVIKYIHIITGYLHERSVNHDKTKLESPEVELFTKTTEQLAGCTYGSEEYKQFLNDLKPALDHHYACNSHHPEHHVKGIDDMNLIDILEMVCDWKAATLRHNDGNLLKSIEHNSKRFNISPQLTNILNNTARLLDDN